MWSEKKLFFLTASAQYHFKNEVYFYFVATSFPLICQSLLKIIVMGIINDFGQNHDNTSIHM